MADAATLSTTPDVDARSERVRRIAAPLDAPAPAGEDVTYDDDFQRVKTEVDRLASAAAGGVDFGLVAELCERILSEKSKDLRVATFFAMALTRTEGLAGAADGVAAVRVLVETFWDDLFPPTRRMRARRNALQALSDRLKEWVVEETPTEGDRDVIEAAVADMRALQAFVLETMGEDAPAVSGLTQAFEAVARRVPRPEPEPAARPQDEAPATRTAPKATASAQATPDGFRSSREAETLILRAASFMLEEDRTDPVPYALVRAVRWGALRQEPPHEGGTTRLPAPVEQRRSYLEGLLQRGDHVTLVAEAESTFREAPFWLDLQRLAVAGMDGAGGAYGAARDVLLYHAAALLQRVPGLADLKFDDGTPFAAPATREWIEMRVGPLLGGGEEGAASGGVEGDPLHDQFQEARRRLGSADLEGALVEMRDGAGGDRNARDRFRRDLYVATLCVRGGHPVVARPLLERLDERIRHHRLDAWEPALALQAWTTLHQCLRTLASDGAAPDVSARMQARAGEVYEHICRLDAAQALRLESF